MTIFQSRVKQERSDEAEIKALADKIVENNRKIQTPTNTTSVIQNNCFNRGTILRYFPKLNSTMPSTDTAKINENRTPDDGPSVLGRFCWTIIGKTCVPCLLKNDGTKYVSVRIAESKVLHNFLQRLNTEVFNCVSVKSFSITDAETKLLNEINKYCEYAFGKEAFNMDSDFIVKLDDLQEFHNFMETCYNKLTHVPSNGVNKCGFVRINDDSVVPYAVKNGQQYVPLFYFEGETESLKTKAINLENWDLAYLKFCCKVQGIKNELFASEQCQVTSLDDVKSYFPEGTKFDEYWPTKLLDMQTTSRNDVNGNHSWVQTPHVDNASVPQTVPTTHTMINKSISMQKQMQNQLHNQRVNSTVINNVNNAPYMANWPNIMSTTASNAPTGNYQVAHVAPVVQPRMQKQNSAGNLHTMNSNPTMTSRNYVGQPVRSHAPQYYSTASNNVPNVSGTVQPPPPLVRVSNANSVPNTYSAASAQNEPYGHLNYSASLPSLYSMNVGGTHPMNNTNASQIHRGRNTVSNQPVQNIRGGYPTPTPPALTPITTSSILPSNNGVPTNVLSRTHRTANYAQNGSEIIDLSSPPHSPQNATNNRRMPNNLGEYKTSNYKSFPPLVNVSEGTPVVKGHAPFKAQTIRFMDKTVLAMNLEPYNYNDYVLTLPDVITHFFPGFDLMYMRHVLQNMYKVTLYRGNMYHMTLLKESQKYKKLDDEIPLIQLKDLEKFYLQLKYLESNISTDATIEREAKRQKIS